MRLHRLVRNLLVIAAGASLLTGTATAANAAPASNEVKITTVRYTAQQFFTSFSQYDSKDRSSCKKVSGGAYKCKTYDAKRNTTGLGHYAACFLSKNVNVPAVVAKRAQANGGMLGVKLAVSIPKLHGGGYWKGYPALWSGTFKKAGTQVLPGTKKVQWMPYYAAGNGSTNWINAGLCLKANSTATIKSFTISYRTGPQK